MATDEWKEIVAMKGGDVAFKQMSWAYDNLKRLESGARSIAKHPEMYSEDDKFLMSVVIENVTRNSEYIRGCIATLNSYAEDFKPREE